MVLGADVVTADGAAAEEGAMSREAEAVLRDLHLRTLESRALLDADSASPWRRSGVVSPVGEQDIKLLQLSLPKQPLYKANSRSCSAFFSFPRPS